MYQWIDSRRTRQRRVCSDPVTPASYKRGGDRRLVEALHSRQSVSCWQAVAESFMSEVRERPILWKYSLEEYHDRNKSCIDGSYQSCILIRKIKN